MDPLNNMVNETYPQSKRNGQNPRSKRNFAQTLSLDPCFKQGRPNIRETCLAISFAESASVDLVVIWTLRFNDVTVTRTSEEQ